MTKWAVKGIIVPMYIPTQEERYSRVAWYTMLMCLVIPSGVVHWAYLKGTDNLLDCAMAFLQPMAHLLAGIGLLNGAAYLVSTVIHALAFFWLVKRCKWTAKKKLTAVVTWGMATAFVWRLMIFHYYHQLLN